MSEQHTVPQQDVGRGGSFVAGCCIGFLLILVVGGLVAIRMHGIESARQEKTVGLLAKLQSLLASEQERDGRPLPRADGSGSDWSGQAAIASYVSARSVPPAGADQEVWLQLMNRDLLRDGWGNPIVYRCPGSAHVRGFDLYSCGPNGRNDQGGFDDVLAGADVAAIETR